MDVTEKSGKRKHSEISGDAKVCRQNKCCVPRASVYLASWVQTDEQQGCGAYTDPDTDTDTDTVSVYI
jgi:hypothetical protein